MSTALDCALDLMLRLPPQNVEENLGTLIQLLPDTTEELLSMVDTPLKIKICSKTGKEFLICDYNRDGDSYRSPWSNEYVPPIEGAVVPSATIRKMEVNANEAFNIYRELYYEGGLSSVYVWELPESGFAAAILIKKMGEQKLGCWDAIHIVEVNEKASELTGKKEAEYKITSTILLYLNVNDTFDTKINLSGQLTRQNIQVFPFRDGHDHISNMGRSVEEMENRLRSSLQEIYFGKTKDVVNALKSSTAASETTGQLDLSKLLVVSPGGTTHNISSSSPPPLPPSQSAPSGTAAAAAAAAAAPPSPSPPPPPPPPPSRAKEPVPSSKSSSSPSSMSSLSSSPPQDHS